MKNTFQIIITFIIFLEGSSILIAQGQVAEYRRISPSQAYEMMQEQDDFILLDVRTTGEFNQRRIPGSINISSTEIGNRAENELPNKEKIILVYCQSGIRSESSARILASLGYINVYDFGGIADWPFHTESSR